MPTYILLSKWTDQGIRNVKDAISRVTQDRAGAEERGVRIIGTWWTQGSYDVVAVVEFPDDEMASAAALRLGMAGNIRTETMRAYTVEQMQRIINKVP